MTNLSIKWREIVKDWRESGESQKGYCRRVGCSANQLSYWIKRLEELDRVSPLLSVKSKPEPSFIQLEPTVSESRSLSSAVELEFASGLVLRIRG